MDEALEEVFCILCFWSGRSTKSCFETFAEINPEAKGSKPKIYLLKVLILIVTIEIKMGTSQKRLTKKNS